MLRTVRNGRVRNAIAVTYAGAVDATVLLYVPPGAERMEATTGLRRGNLVSFDEPWEHEPGAWRDTNVLWLGRLDEPYALLVFWDAAWELLAWYVQLQDPLRPCAAGWDTRDHLLDVVIEPDGTWGWKDEDELEHAVELGLVSPAEAEAARATGERVLAQRPWPTGFEDWRPDPAWPAPTLRPDWHVV